MFYLPTIKNIANIPDKSSPILADTQSAFSTNQYSFVNEILDSYSLAFIPITE
jgi:hypothetical protein